MCIRLDMQLLMISVSVNKSRRMHMLTTCCRHTMDRVRIKSVLIPTFFSDFPDILNYSMHVFVATVLKIVIE